MSAAGPIDWRRNQAAVTIAAFIGFTGFTLVMPFLPLFFEELGVEDPARIAIWSGLSLGITPAVTAVMAPLWGRVADRFGRKPMVVRSLVSFVVIMSLMAWVQEAWQVFALRAVQGFFAGYGAIVLTMAADSAPPDKTAIAIGWVQTAQRLGPALGPVIGGSVAHWVGLRNSFLVAACFYLLAVLLVLAGYREPGRGERRHAAPRVRAAFATFRAVPNFVLFMAVIFGLQLADRSFGPVLPLFLLAAGTPVAGVPFLSGLIFTAVAGAAALGNQTCVWWLRRVPFVTLTPGSLVVSAVAAALFGAASTPALLLPAAALFGYGIGLATTAIYTTASASVRAEVRGAAFGYLTTAFLFGLALSPMLAGLIGAVSVRAVFFVDAAGLLAIGWVIRRKMGTSHALAEG